MKVFIKKALVPIIAIVIASVMVVCYFVFVLPKLNEGEKHITLEIVYSNMKYKYEETSKANTIYELLLDLNDKCNLEVVVEDSAYGKFLMSIKGIAQNESQGLYYVYSVTDVEFASAIDVQTFKDGDIIIIELKAFS